MSDEHDEFPPSTQPDMQASVSPGDPIEDPMAASTAPPVAPPPPVAPAPPSPTDATPMGSVPPAPPSRARSGLATVMVASLVAGAVGGGVGYFAAEAANHSTSTSAEAPLVQTVVSGSSTVTSNDIEAVAKQVLPSVVKINVSGPQGAGSGSGIIITTDGEILTNNHVVELAGNGGSIIVNFNDGSTVRAHVIGTDPVTDVAVIKADNVSGLTPATLGSSSSLQVGQPVVAIGSPFGLEATVTSGIVSSLNRPVSVDSTITGTGANVSYPAIQTDAAINPGNSGGPLVNLAGQVVGINSSIFTDTQTGGQGGSIGLGFSIPIDNILPIVNQIRAGETPTHALLGVRVDTASEQGGLVTGAGVVQVDNGSAAAGAGLQVGDVITAVDGLQVADSSSLVAAIHGHRPGDSVTLTVDRSGTTVTLHATLGSDS